MQHKLFPQAAVLMAFLVALLTVVSVASGKLPQAGVDFNAASSAPASLPLNSAQEISRNHVAERLFRSSWGTADMDVYARIANAFDSEPLQEAELRGVECRGQLCRVSFYASADLPVRKLLPVQLAEAFRTMVTVHDGDTNLVYLEVPGRG